MDSTLRWMRFKASKNRIVPLESGHDAQQGEREAPLPVGGGGIRGEPIRGLAGLDPEVPARGQRQAHGQPEARADGQHLVGARVIAVRIPGGAILGHLARGRVHGEHARALGQNATVGRVEDAEDARARLHQGIRHPLLRVRGDCRTTSYWTRPWVASWSTCAPPKFSSCHASAGPLRPQDHLVHGTGRATRGHGEPRVPTPTGPAARGASSRPRWRAATRPERHRRHRVRSASAGHSRAGPPGPAAAPATAAPRWSPGWRSRAGSRRWLLGRLGGEGRHRARGPGSSSRVRPPGGLQPPHLAQHVALRGHDGDLRRATAARKHEGPLCSTPFRRSARPA